MSPHPVDFPRGPGGLCSFASRPEQWRPLLSLCWWPLAGMLTYVPGCQTAFGLREQRFGCHQGSALQALASPVVVEHNSYLKHRSHISIQDKYVMNALKDSQHNLFSWKHFLDIEGTLFWFFNAVSWLEKISVDRPDILGVPSLERVKAKFWNCFQLVGRLWIAFEVKLTGSGARRGARISSVSPVWAKQSSLRLCMWANPCASASAPANKQTTCMKSKTMASIATGKTGWKQQKALILVRPQLSNADVWKIFP